MQSIKKKVEDQLFWDNRVDSTDIKVEVANGTVTLSGKVPNYTARRAAELDARIVPGVLSVKNLLTVEYPPTIAIPDDESIQSGIQNRIDWSASISAADIKVKVQSGLVTLTGSVDAYWKKLRAEEMAWDAVGVVEVKNELSVVPTHKMTDELIGEEVMKAIDRNINVDVNTVDVTVKDGIVTLSGVVKDWYAKVAAYNAALYTLGVVEVRDDIMIEG
jgi:osmotically-inducible protein OsmY